MNRVSISDFKTGAIHEVLNDDARYRIYIIRDGDIVLYVGMSKCAVTRMESHVGVGEWRGFWGSSLDQWLDKRVSDSYTVDLYDEEEVMEAYQSMGHQGDCDAATEGMESRLIYELSPVFNAMGQKKSRENSIKWQIKHPPRVISLSE